VVAECGGGCGGLVEWEGKSISAYGEGSCVGGESEVRGGESVVIVEAVRDLNISYSSGVDLPFILAHLSIPVVFSESYIQVVQH
jgi:hypothetical protein